jgi:hypothetical protein
VSTSGEQADLNTAVALAKVSANLEALTAVVVSLQQAIGTYIPREVYQADRMTLTAEVATLKAAQASTQEQITWAVRIVLSVVFLAVLALVVTKTGGVPR